MKDEKFLLLLNTIAFIGLGLTIFLLYQQYSKTEICDISNFISCSTVLASEYSKFFGIPVALFGTIYFVIIIILLILYQENKKFLNYAFYISILALFPSFTLTYLEFFVIKAVCIFCELTKILIVIITIFLWKKKISLKL